VTIFDYLKDVVVFKKGSLPLDEYIPFLINRWLSFFTPQVCPAINESVNRLGSMDKEQHYRLLLRLFPKQKFMPRINYIKKVKHEKTKEDDRIEHLSQNLELSQRETKLLLELTEQLT
jgi:hypothetical protein